MATPKKPKIELPAEFKNDEPEFLRHMREQYAYDESYDSQNRESGIEDLQFVVGEQWDAEVQARREAKRKPVLTVNRLPAFVAQVVGARMQNETGIKVIPDNNGTLEIARVREGLMRSIQKNSRAEQAFDNALMGSVCAGIGNFQIEIDYESDEVWHQSIKISPLADHFSVVWDRSRTEPTGEDAARCYVVETMPDSTFRELYPWATPTDIITDRMPAELRSSGWYTGEDVRIVNYWHMRERERTIALMQSGETVDITDEDDPTKLTGIMRRPDGSLYIRKVYRKYAQMYRCSGSDVLEGPYNLPIDRIPVFRVPAWELRIGGQTYRWGLITHLKDPQRLHNFWRSATAEKIMQSPKNTWIAADTAVAGRENQWRQSNVSDDPLLVWNSESGQPPQRQDPIQMEPALLTQAELTTQDLKDVSNIHEASLGMPSNEVSGVALDRRVAIGETGSAVYHDNLRKAIEECGRVINQLIPVVYDTARVVRVMGEDAQSYMQAINSMTDGSVDIGAGKYSVTASTGPSYKTKRIEQADSMMKLANAMPQTLGVSADLIIEAQDWPMASRIAERLRMGMDPTLLTNDEITPAVQQSIQSRQQAQQAQMEATMKKLMTEELETMSKVAVNAARAAHLEVQAAAEPQRLANETTEKTSEAASRELRDRLEAIELAESEDMRKQEPTNV